MTEERPLTQGEMVTKVLTEAKAKGMKQKRVPPGLLLMHLKSGLNCRQIAKLYGVKERTVYMWVEKHKLDIRSIRAYQENKGDLISAVASRVLASVDDTKINRASLRDTATTFNILNNAERLEQGKATSHIEVHTLNKSIDSLQEMEDKILKEIEDLKGKFKV